ncbi:gcc2 and gcc3 domain-containing protein [Cystoisospora suis]|uniref:Gcc2 and gcc3 domain-containing protein n=1 Tax=Cystoisospora suis TaxID=483139 RepID=A0A2C6KU48_9APIC|nr:gcc2 and gcc3 domain-containing protein [Cystoisospora suis]
MLTYQPIAGSGVCLECPKGFFCPVESDSGTERACPEGHFCRAGAGQPSPCPSGTYALAELFGDEADCAWCPPGRQCEESGLSREPALCPADYYCPPPLFVLNPNSKEGVFCQATEDAAPSRNCPVKPITVITHREEKRVCQLFCTGARPGNRNGREPLLITQTRRPKPYCSPAGEPGPSAKSFFCTSRAYRPICLQWALGSLCFTGSFCRTPSHLLSPVGAHGSDTPLCRSLFSSGTSVRSCAEAPASWPNAGPIKSFSNLMGPVSCPCMCVSLFSCPPDRICPAGSSAPQQCPLGQFKTDGSSASSQACRPCLAGRYCSPTGESGPCAPGFFCTSGAYRPTPFNKPLGGLCPAGTFCPGGSTAAVACRRGTVGPGSGSTDSCDDCPAGSFCPSEGLSIRAASTEDSADHRSL